MFEYREVKRPYPGLRPFEPWENSIFFGRDRHIDRLQDILKSRHFLTVTGPSGSGKSSLVRAGLLPALPLGAIGTGTSWRFVIMRPGDKPISNLAKELFDSNALEPELKQIEKLTNSTPTLPTLEAELRRGPLGLIDLVNDLRRNLKDPDFNLLILVDQFEEIFTYADAGIDQADESDAFVNLLLAASQKKDARIFVVITLRTDFLGACTRFQDLPDEINRSLYLTPRLNRQQLTEAIAGPAASYALKLPDDLVAEYVNASQNEPDQLPLLQHALANRWDQSQQPSSNATQADVFYSVSNLGQALSEHADTVYQALTDEQRLDAQWLFRAITEHRAAEAGGQMVRRPRSLELIAKWSGRPWQRFIPILQAFADSKVNFLTYQGQPGEPEKNAATVVDISHEAVMRQWNRLKNWIDSEDKAKQAYDEWVQRAMRKKSGDGSYLNDADLSRAEIWLEQGLNFDSPSPQSPQPDSAPQADWANRYSQDTHSEQSFETVKEFILQSRNASRFFRRLWYSSAVFLLITCLSTAWFGYSSYQQTIRSAAKSLWFPFRTDTILTEGNGANALSTVAKQDKDIRLSFIEGILSDENNATIFSSNPTLFLRASIQSDLILRDRLLQRLREEVHHVDSISLARMQALLELDLNAGMQQLLQAVSTNKDSNLINALGVNELIKHTDKLNENKIKSRVALLVEMIIKTTDADLLGALSQALAPLARKLDAHQVEQVAAHYIETIFQATKDYQCDLFRKGLGRMASMDDMFEKDQKGVTGVTCTTANVNKIFVLSKILATLANKLDEHQVAQVVAHYMKRIDQTTNEYRFLALGEGLAALANKLDENLTKQAVVHYLEMFDKTTDANQFLVLGEGLTTLASKLDEYQLAQVVAHYRKRIDQTTNEYRFLALGEGLAALANQLDENLTKQAVVHYLEMFDKTTDANQFLVLGEGLTQLLNKLNEHQAEQVFSHYKKMVVKSMNATQLYVLSKGLATLRSKLDEHQVSQVIADYFEITLKTTDASQLEVLGKGLAPLVSKTDVRLATQVVAHYMKMIAQTTDFKQNQTLRNGLAPLASQLDENQVKQVAVHYLEMIGKTKNPSEFKIFLGQEFTLLASQLDENQGKQVAAHYLEMIGKTKNPSEFLIFLGQEFSPLASQLDENQVRQLIAHYIEMIGKSQHIDQLRNLSYLFSSLTSKFDENLTTRIVAHYIESIGETKDVEKLRTLSHELIPFANKLDKHQGKQVVAHYREMIVQTTDKNQLRALGNGLANISARLGDTVVEPLAITLPTHLHGITGAQQAALAEPVNTIIPRLALSGNLAKTWLEMSNIPFIDREAVAASIRKHYPDAPREEEGIWIFLQWANHHFGLSRPDSAELVPAVMYIFLLPLLVLFSGSALLHIVSGRKLVALQLSKLKYSRDRKPLDLRFLGYTADQTNIHWGALGNDERLYEQRFLAMDLIFAPIYGLAFLYALLLASGYLGEPVPTAWFMILVGTMVLADWLENAIQFQQLKRLNPQGGGLQENWIRVASIATQIKLISMASAIALLFYFSGQLMFF